MGKFLLALAFSLVSLPAMATSPEDYYNAGTDLLKNKDYEKAVRYFHAAVDQRPDYWQATQFLGVAYYQNGNITAGLMYMEQSLRLHPDNPELRKFMAKIRDGSPWAPRRSLAGYLSVFAILLSLLASGWTAYWTYRYLPRLKNPPPQP